MTKIKSSALPVFIMLFLSNAVGAQAPIQTESYKIPGFSATIINNKVLDAKGLDSSIQGSPYLNDDYKIAKVSNTNETVIARYNIYTDEVEFKRGNEVLILPKNETYALVNIQPNTNLVLHNNEYYLKLHESDNGSLLKKDKITFKKGREASNGYETSQLAKYINEKPTFYILKDNNIFEINKKIDFDDLYMNKKASEYIKSEKINIKDEQSLIKLIKYLTSK